MNPNVRFWAEADIGRPTSAPLLTDGVEKGLVIIGEP
jgi:hypothetical protein